MTACQGSHWRSSRIRSAIRVEPQPTAANVLTCCERRRTVASTLCAENLSIASVRLRTVLRWRRISVGRGYSGHDEARLLPGRAATKNHRRAIADAASALLRHGLLVQMHSSVSSFAPHGVETAA